MSSNNIEFENKVLALIGSQLSNGVRDYGKIVDYTILNSNGDTVYVLLLENGRRIEARSAMRFLRAYAVSQGKATPQVYPDGSDAVIRNRVMKVRRSGMRSVTGASITNVAKFDNDQSINISSTITSAGAFTEDYVVEDVKQKPNGLTIDEVLEKAGISVNEYFSSKKEEKNDN